MASNPTLYRQHLAALDHVLHDAIARAGRKGLALDGVVFHAGRSIPYHVDDQEPPFHPTPHFRRYVPLEGPEHLVLARPGRKPLVVRYAPADYWYETIPLAPSYWQDEVELKEAASFAEAVTALGPLGRTAYVGNSAAAAGEIGIPAEMVEPDALMRPLDWHRAVKTEHEIALMVRAAEKSAEGHRVGRKAFEAGASEIDIHRAYLAAAASLEKDVPFETIVALDAKSATLHYQSKRGAEAAPGKVLLLDAGATHDGYASDITRTWVVDGVQPEFRQLLEGLDAFQRDLVAMVTPGRAPIEMHVEWHRRAAQLMVEVGVIKGSVDEALAKRVTAPFLPHGLGHHLGIQVHDIAGRQATPDGGTNPPPAEHPYLRNTRALEPGHVMTIEPGIYFIPLLLDQLRAAPGGALVNWSLVQALIPCGGIRIEDDVLCTTGAARDLTRDLIPGPRGV